MARMKEKELVTAITDALNGGIGMQKFCEEMSREHRYLQGEFTFLCLEWFRQLREMYESGNYDGRNEYACKAGKQIMDSLEGKK